MKFIVSSLYLRKELAAINGVITTNPVVPILENFLFEIQDGILTVTASDLQTSMITELEVEAKEDGSIAVPSKMLMDTLANLPEQPVTFSIDEETYSIEINSDNGRYKLSGEHAADFPRVPTISEGNSVDIPSDVLANAIHSTIYATSSDELRPAMTGVYMQLTAADTTFVGTDAHRLIRYKRADVTAEGEHSMIVPRKALALLKSTLPAENIRVNVEFNEANAFFKFGNIFMVCRLIDEKFPDYENVIPFSNDNNMTIDRVELLGSLRRIAIYANRVTHQVRFKISGNDLLVFSEDVDFSNEANERLSCEHDGEDIDIGFNGKFLIEMLGSLSSRDITLKMSEPNKAGLLIPSDQDEHEDLVMVVMPVMLSSRGDY